MDFITISTELLKEGAAAQRKFCANEQDKQFLVQNLLEHLGNENAQVRDSICLRLFMELLQYQILTTEDFEQLYDKIVHEKLLFEVDQQASNSVFTRALSAFWLVQMIQYDEALTLQRYEEIFEQIIILLSREKDLRAYVDGNNFAYSIGNAANLLTVLVNHTYFDSKNAYKVLQVVKDNMWKQHVFADDEDEHLVKVLMAVSKKVTDDQILIEWIEQLFDSLQFTEATSGYNVVFLRARTQTMHILRSYYFALKFSRQHEKLQAVLTQFISKWNMIS